MKFLISPAPPMNCTAPLHPPKNGSISEHSVPAIPGTQLTFKCDDGLFAEGIMNVICLVTGEWDKNPEDIVCRIELSKLYFILHVHPHPVYSASCGLPAPPLNGALINTDSQNTNPTEGSVITFQCDPAFSLHGGCREFSLQQLWSLGS